MKFNEQILFREYKLTVDELWETMQEDQTDKKIIAKATYLTELNKELGKRIKHMIYPNRLLNDVEKKEIFNNWCTNWAVYIDDMSDEEYQNFVDAEETFYSSKGKIKDIENFYPPKLKKKAQAQIRNEKEYTK